MNRNKKGKRKGIKRRKGEDNKKGEEGKTINGEKMKAK